MIYAGCDLGTVAAKVVIMDGGTLLAAEAIAYRNLPKQAAVDVFEKALAGAGVSAEEIDYCVATGFGKKTVAFADADVPELVAVNRAVGRLNPEVRTVIDAGGQSMKALSIGAKGRIVDSAANEKCASGTGKFMEVMARALGMPLGELCELAISADGIVPITSQCGVFAESEVISYVNDGKDRADIFAGISRSVASKVSSLVRRIDVIEPVVLVGGVAKNAAVRRHLEEELGLKLAVLNMDPQLVGALGAALIAREKHAAQN